VANIGKLVDFVPQGLRTKAVSDRPKVVRAPGGRDAATLGLFGTLALTGEVGFGLYAIAHERRARPGGG
jgi:hypothetical protein